MSSTGGGRRISIDVYRGLAILAMVIYHALWDLAYYRLIETGIGTDPAWIGAQRGIVTAFLLLVGAGLWLAHGRGIDWRRFWKRQAIVVAAALGVSAVTWVQFGADYFAYFGVLHVIALSSLLALPLLRAPAWLVLALALGVLAAPAIWSWDLFNARGLSWIGFFTETPQTADLVPLFPWFGVVLLGMLAMRLGGDAPVFTWRSDSRLLRGLAVAGRWSLVIYLVHQPLLFGAITPIAGALDGAQQARLDAFLGSCRSACVANESEPFCTAYCACALDVTIRDDLWESPPGALRGMIALCTEMARR